MLEPLEAQRDALLARCRARWPLVKWRASAPGEPLTLYGVTDRRYFSLGPVNAFGDAGFAVLAAQIADYRAVLAAEQAALTEAA